MYKGGEQREGEDNEQHKDNPMLHGPLAPLRRPAHRHGHGNPMYRACVQKAHRQALHRQRGHSQVQQDGKLEGVLCRPRRGLLLLGRNMKTKPCTTMRERTMLKIDPNLPATEWHQQIELLNRQIEAVECLIANSQQARAIVAGNALGNIHADSGCDRCRCGCKYWENDRCIDCGHVHSGRSEDYTPNGYQSKGL